MTAAAIQEASSAIALAELLSDPTKLNELRKVAAEAIGAKAAADAARTALAEEQKTFEAKLRDLEARESYMASHSESLSRQMKSREAALVEREEAIGAKATETARKLARLETEYVRIANVDGRAPAFCLSIDLGKHSIGDHMGERWYVNCLLQSAIGSVGRGHDDEGSLADVNGKYVGQWKFVGECHVARNSRG